MKHEIKLVPFSVPNNVRSVRNSIGADVWFPVYELSDETLDQLCDQFRKDLKERVRQNRSRPRV